MDNEKFKEAVAAVIKDKSQREALAQLITEFINPNHITVDFISMLLNARSLAVGDSLVKKVRKGIKVFTFVPGAIPLKSEVMVVDRINYVLDGLQVGLLANEWDLESGDIGTVESMRAEALAKLRDAVLTKVFTALTTIWTAANTPLNFTDAGATITATALENAIDRINQTTSGAKAIVGVRSVLTPITKFGAFWNDGATSPTTFPVDSQMEKAVQDGFLGKFYGVPIVALNQIYNNVDDYTPLLPTTRVLVIGDNVGEFITYGPVRTKEWTDNEPTPPYWHWDAYTMFGMLITNANGLYSIKVG
jgi:hypothetical protein